jgi:hypothetical protein
MQRRYWLALLAALLTLAILASTASATAYHSITIDGNRADWQAGDGMETDGPDIHRGILAMQKGAQR